MGAPMERFYYTLVFLLIMGCATDNPPLGKDEAAETCFDCDPCFNVDPCTGECISPIVLDLAGDGIAMTDAQSGVLFDMVPDGEPDNVQYSWTAGADDAWLVLDRNGDGLINDSRELFGNFTDQPPPAPGTYRNGYLALAVFDANEDGRIDAADPIYTQLRLWRDYDHDGVSNLGELDTLAAHGILGLSLDYRIGKRQDEYGNRFFYRGDVYRARDSSVAPKCYDVYLLSAPHGYDSKLLAFTPNVCAGPPQPCTLQDNECYVYTWDFNGSWTCKNGSFVYGYMGQRGVLGVLGQCIAHLPIGTVELSCSGTDVQCCPDEGRNSFMGCLVKHEEFGLY
jgi:hypothetical protein